MSQPMEKRESSHIIEYTFRYNPSISNTLKGYAMFARKAYHQLTEWKRLRTRQGRIGIEYRPIYTIGWLDPAR